MGPVLRALLVAVTAVPCIAVREIPAQRQSTDGVGASGQRVRVTMRGGDRAIGQLVGIGADSVTLLLAEGGDRKVIARSTIEGVAVTRGKRGNALKGLALGAGGGLIVGAIAGAMAGSECRGEYFCPNEGGGAALLGVAGAFAGGLTGAVVGAFVRTEKWSDTFVLPGPRVAVGLMKKGVGVRILTH